MNKKNMIFFIAVIAINLIYGIYIVCDKVFANVKSETPVLSFNSDMIEVSVKDPQDALLDDVRGYDKEDGDISNNVFIYGISPFDEQGTRTITYGVFDSDDQMVTKSRKMKYTDYSKPRFYSSKPLMNLMLGGSASTYVSATSSVDGDISNNVSMNTTLENDRNIYTYNVTDSTGTSSSLVIKDESNISSLLNSNITINLKDYIIYVKKGKVINPMSYVENVETSLGVQNELKYLIRYETNYDMTKEGTYEVKYTINRSNGDYGITKLIVIVE